MHSFARDLLSTSFFNNHYFRSYYLNLWQRFFPGSVAGQEGDDSGDGDNGPGITIFKISSKRLLLGNSNIIRNVRQHVPDIA